MAKEVELLLPYYYDVENQVELPYELFCPLTDLTILTGSDYDETLTSTMLTQIGDVKGRKKVYAPYFTMTFDDNGYVKYIDGTKKCISGNVNPNESRKCIRPVLKLSLDLFTKICQDDYRYGNKRLVKFGEYPQYVVNFDLVEILETKYKNDELEKTGGSYSVNKHPGYKFIERKYFEYIFEGKKYIRMQGNDFARGDIGSVKLTDNEYYSRFVWLEVSPVEWFIDYENHMLISKNALLSGIRMHKDKLDATDDFQDTEMKEYLDKHMLSDLLQSTELINYIDMTKEEKKVMINPKKEFEQLKTDIEMLKRILSVESSNEFDSKKR